MVVPLQSIAGGGLLALVVTFLLTAAFYAFTLHLAATFFIGDVPSQRAAYAAPVPALVSILLGEYGQSGVFGIGPDLLVGVALVVALLADLAAVSVAYRLKLRSAVPVVVLHFAFAAVLGIALGNLLGVGLLF
ncbi:hypothetical protein DM867_03390 [Halosegnis rubeus]|jgi:hypothetical protein|uniref:Uncharacterized protein n=1 Tax=Halosegnis rubeus TaxID=2212850 RepID=A0A5N5UFM3_9EURY|nr:hypothetical protein [Halosegnis rubeus]KAB7515141.1 hypothetical protein DMP03_07770 [Halosegnis rubeus]KAB7516195.1 hypothetical protein DM867_03390 [Halosegnis rubeus]KAB7517501.1 hypothetical protein DP108_07910 [Halosegnis rubeus]